MSRYQGIQLPSTAVRKPSMSPYHPNISPLPSIVLSPQRTNSQKSFRARKMPDFSADSGETVAIGGPRNTGEFGDTSGHARIFKFQNSVANKICVRFLFF